MKILKTLLAASLVFPIVLMAGLDQYAYNGKNGQCGENGEDGGFYGGNGGHGGDGGSSLADEESEEIDEYKCKTLKNVCR